MNRQLIKILTQHAEELEKFFGDDAKSYFSEGEGLYIEKRTVIKSGELISVRVHPRFCPTLSHRHNYIEIMYVCQGTITHIINGAEVVMEAGDILLMNQHLSHALKPAGKDDIGINLLVLPEFFETAIGMLDKNNFLADFIIDLLRRKNRSSQYLHFKLADNLQTNNLMENLIYSLVHKHKNSTRINQTLMGVLFLYLLENADALRHDAPNNYEEIMSRSVQMYIDQHFKTATLSEIAADMHLPVAHLSRFVRKMTGRTFKELLQERRFEVARSKLAETTLPISDIMAAVGYENSSYFFRRFRQKYGISPKEYRAMRKKPNAEGKRGRTMRLPGMERTA
jgi:AraC-like DNA-binding protein/mannose-6-phosphate isomerase-like protein (cupin superfamily)